MNKIIIERILWTIVWTFLVRPFPRKVASSWEIFLLRLFKAQIGQNCIVYSSANIWLPRNLVMEDGAIIADHVRIQNKKTLYLRSNSVIAQFCYICDGNHAVDDVANGFSKSIEIGENSWIGANCYIGIGVHIGRGCAVGARSVVRSNTPPYSIILGNPAKVVGFNREPSEILEYEKERFSEDKRLSVELLNKNYQRYFVKRIKQIKEYTSI